MEPQVLALFSLPVILSRVSPYYAVLGCGCYAILWCKMNMIRHYCRRAAASQLLVRECCFVLDNYWFHGGDYIMNTMHLFSLKISFRIFSLVSFQNSSVHGFYLKHFQLSRLLVEMSCFLTAWANAAAEESRSWSFSLCLRQDNTYHTCERVWMFDLV